MPHADLSNIPTRIAHLEQLVASHHPVLQRIGKQSLYNDTEAKQRVAAVLNQANRQVAAAEAANRQLSQQLAALTYRVSRNEAIAESNRSIINQLVDCNHSFMDKLQDSVHVSNGCQELVQEMWGNLHHQEITTQANQEAIQQLEARMPTGMGSSAEWEQKWNQNQETLDELQSAVDSLRARLDAIGAVTKSNSDDIRAVHKGLTDVAEHVNGLLSPPPPPFPRESSKGMERDPSKSIEKIQEQLSRMDSSTSHTMKTPAPALRHTEALRRFEQVSPGGSRPLPARPSTSGKSMPMTRPVSMSGHPAAAATAAFGTRRLSD